MAEAIAVIGAVGAIASIIDVVTKSIKCLNNTRLKWKAANLTCLSLASQLTALRAALTKIKEWMDSSLGDAHHQLIMDLDLSISCCKLLVCKIDSLLPDSTDFLPDSLDIPRKLRTMLSGQEIEGIQKSIERQTNALTLLLTACNCTSLAEQKVLLERPKSRKTLKKLKIDSASLCVHRDTDTSRTQFSDTLSGLSKVFKFDNALFTSPIYERVFRGSLKATLRRQQSPTEVLQQRPHTSVQHRPDTTNRVIPGCTLPPIQERKVLVLSTDQKAKSRFLSPMRLYAEGKDMSQGGGPESDRYSIPDLDAYRPAIRNTVLLCFEVLLNAMKHLKIDCGIPDNQLRLIRFSAIKVNSVLTPSSAELMAHIWKDPSIPKVLKLARKCEVSAMLRIKVDLWGHDLVKLVQFFLRNIQRIVSQDYKPTQHDVLRAWPVLRDRYELDFLPYIGTEPLLLFNPVWDHPTPLRVSPVQESCSELLFVVNLEDWGKPNRLSESLVFFDSVVNSSWARDSAIILVFCWSKSREGASSLLSNYEEAQPEILHQFEQRNCAKLNLYSHWLLSDPDDSFNVWRIFVSVNNDIARKQGRSDIMT